jgi:hypothetical protein
MLQFCTTIRRWLIVLLLGAFSFQALAASASELCRFQCQKDWKTNAASLGSSPGDTTDQWSLFSTPCPDLLTGSESVSAEDDACTSCGMCALNSVFTLPEIPVQMDLKQSPKPQPEHAQASAWLNGSLFKPPRS